MKCIFSKSIAILLGLALLVLCGCAQGIETIPAPSETESNSVEDAPLDYTMSVYTQASNSESTLDIEYPIFAGKGSDGLNTLIYDKVQNVVTSTESSDKPVEMHYQCAVTLNDREMVSMVFWGNSSVEGGAYPKTDLIPLNIDLSNLKEVKLNGLYDINSDFEAIFFSKAFFPTNPVTSYDEASFPQMLELQTPEYQTVDPFSTPGNVTCFLKPEGIVFSMPAVHATGSDHFEAELKYSDISQFAKAKLTMPEARVEGDALNLMPLRSVNGDKQSEFISTYIDLNGDGHSEGVLITIRKLSPTEEYSDAELTLFISEEDTDPVSLTIPMYGGWNNFETYGGSNFVYAYAADAPQKDGIIELLIGVKEENDLTWTYCFRYADNKIQKTQHNGDIKQITSEYITFNVLTDLFGTHGATTNYILNDKYEFENPDKTYYLYPEDIWKNHDPEDTWSYLEIKKPLPVKINDVETKLSVGTKIFMIKFTAKYDIEALKAAPEGGHVPANFEIYFVTDQGQKGVLTFDCSFNGYLIEELFGEPVENWFVELHYAG